MAVGDNTLPVLHPVAGFRLATCSAGIKTPGRPDVVLMALCEGASSAGVFTRNAFCAAPVQIAKRHLAHISSRYWLVNTGNANAGTGQQGLHDSVASCAGLAVIAAVDEAQVLPFSTGVIGERLPVTKIIDVLPELLAGLTEAGWVAAASGIMTTDTRPKAASQQFQYYDPQQGRDDQLHTITVTGIAKGAGMIKPNMATMLSYIATDAPVEPSLLQEILTAAVNQSFNRISIDGDTSTNDSCMLAATGKVPVAIVDSRQHPLYQLLSDAITAVSLELAQGLVRDGEGASKFVTVAVSGGATEQECLQVAYTIAESPLVKTALFASDANWGRLLMAIGRSGVDHLDVDQVEVRINGVLIAEQGCRAASYTEEQGAAAMEEEEITIAIELNRGGQQATVWTSDLSHEYVRINAEYRT